MGGQDADRSRRSTRGAFASRLRDHRLSANLSQEELAERAGLSAQAISMLERGVRSAPRTSTIESLAAALGLDESQRQTLIAMARRRSEAAPEPGAPSRRLDAGPGGALARRDAGQVPRELPRPHADFTGREAELAAVCDLLDPARARSGLVVIDGMAGVGKSALAIQAAHRLVAAGAYPDGQLYVDLHGASPGLTPLPPHDALGRLLRSLGLDPASVPRDAEEAAARFRSLVATRRLLLVLDNARSTDQVRLVLPGSPSCAVVVTSREPLASVGAARRLRLDVLPPAPALELLARIGGLERIAGEPAAAAEVVRACGGLPLALRIAGARLALRPHWTVHDLAERLDDAAQRLQALHLGELAVRASFETSLRALTEGADRIDGDAAAAFGLLSTPDGPDLSLAAAARLLGRPEAVARNVLERLVDVQLLETVRSGRYRFHDLVRLYAREHAARSHSESERMAALGRLSGFYTATAWRTLSLLRPGDRRADTADPRWTGGGLAFPDTPAALAWLEAERGNLVAAIMQATRSADRAFSWELAGQLSRALFGFFVVRGHWTDWVRVNQAVLDAARQAADRAGQACTQADLGAAYEWLGRYPEAIASHQESLALFRELGDGDGEAGSLNNLGSIYDRLGRLTDAVDCLRESLVIFRRLAKRRGQATSLTNLGVAYRRLGRCDDAIACLEESLDIFRELDAVLAQANTLMQLGVVHRQQGRFPEAIACHRESLDLFTALGASFGQARSLHELGVAYRLSGHAEDAVICLRKSLAIARELNALGSQAQALRDLGDALLAAGCDREARSAWRDGLRLSERNQLPEVEEIRARLAHGTARAP
jgi:tetratricopeptide (TPR) repeat protein/transcriptional regulator with XRE-family HTH domain